LDSFDANKGEEQDKVELLQANVVKLLGHISRNWAQLDKTAVITGMDEYDLAGIGGKATEAKTAPELQEGRYIRNTEHICTCVHFKDLKLLEWIFT
jgi:DNA topoisomerase IA